MPHPASVARGSFAASPLPGALYGRLNVYTWVESGQVPWPDLHKYQWTVLPLHPKWSYPLGMENSDGLAKLTEREKVCLRQWLEHKSAKEIAIDLHISHHAVEKRLKMARLKLGAASSLQAARMLGEAEGYGRTVAQMPDLAANGNPIQTVVARPIILGAIMMSLIGVGLLALAMQPIGETSTPTEASTLTREYDQQLKSVLSRLIATAEIGPDGDVFLRAPVGDQRFQRLDSGHYWQISAEGVEAFGSRSLGRRVLSASGRKGPAEPLYYNSDQFPDEPLRMVQRTIRLPGSNREWQFIVARARHNLD